jgi:NodT family efflux transporter outer membrane factor (OMF) lipoprotein
MTMMMRISVLVVVAVLAGCRAQAPVAGLPLQEKAKPGAAWVASGSERMVAEPTAWLTQFDDATLRSAVTEAVEGNPDLRVAAARMVQAEARAIRSGAQRFPSAGMSLRTNEDWRQVIAGPGEIIRQRQDVYALNLDVSWEVDVWGRVRNNANAGRANAQAAAADYEAARLSLAANAARAWCNLLEAEWQARLASETVASFRKNLATVDSNFDKGVPGVTALDVRFARSSLASAEANLENRKRGRDEARRVLEGLMGRYPAGVFETSGKLPSLRRDIPVGMPSDLLLRRPDIAAAERRTAAALQTAKAARRALLPSFRITGDARTISEELMELLDEKKLVRSLVISLTQPIFQGGALRSDVKLAQAQAEELAQRYASVALTAFREVETALAAEIYLDGQIAALRRFAEESREAEKLAVSQYERGLTGILNVLESQRRAFDSQSGLIRAENQRLQTRIDLCLALGGGF